MATHLSPEKVRDQLFWEGREGDLKNWFAYTCRAPHFHGHVMLAHYNQELMALVDRMKNGKRSIMTPDEARKTCECPTGFEKALLVVSRYLFNWACEYKTAEPYIVFSRMNIGREQFRVHIYPLSPGERDEASRLLRLDTGTIERGGLGYLVGLREREAEALETQYRVADPVAYTRLLNSTGVRDLTHQLRDIVNTQSGG